MKITNNTRTPSLLEYRNPNYIPNKTSCNCSICDEGIYCGEEYIQNERGEYAHWECIKGIKHLLNWLGYEITIMED